MFGLILGEKDNYHPPTKLREGNTLASVCHSVQGRGDRVVAFWVTNPCRITHKVKQTKMYVCTLEEFILVDIWIHCCASWKWICIGNAVVYIQSQQ